MKKNISVSLLLFLLANGVGFYVYFFVRMEAIHRDRKATLLNCPNDQLQKILFTPRQYQQAHTNEKEIEWEGIRYDISKTEWKRGRVIVFALRDDAETELISFFENLIEVAWHDDQLPPIALTQYLSMLFIVPSINFSIAPVHPFKLDYFIFSPFNFQGLYQELLAPPPRA